MAKESFARYHRTLQISILALFLSLFIASFAFVITFTYVKNRNAIEKFSLEEIERVSTIVFERVNALIDDAEQISKLTASTISSVSEISFTDPDLTTYLKTAIQEANNFSNIYVASNEGIYVGATDIFLSSQTHYFSNPSKPLPKEAIYGLLTIDSEKSPIIETCEYYDKKLNPICYEQFKTNFDPRTRPWYQGALKADDLYWTDIYTFQDTHDKGVSVSSPIRNKEGSIVGVSAVDISFVLLSNFFSEQRLGKSGQTFLLDRSGEVLVAPDVSKRHGTNLSEHVINTAFSEYQKNKQNSFLFKEGDTTYLAFLDRVPIASAGKDWVIMILVPHSDFFGDLQKEQTTVLLVTFCILLICSILVYFFSKRLATPIVRLSQEVDKLTQLDLTSDWRIKSQIKELIRMDRSIASLRSALRSFTRYVPKEVVKDLIHKGEEISIGGEKKDITVLFSDIAGFTTLSEFLSTEETMSLLTEYFDALSKIILDTDGIIDKYIGDSIMAFWGAPHIVPDHAVRGCTAALRCQAFLLKFNEKRTQEKKPAFPTRFSLNSGPVIIGNIGTEERMNYTVIGDMVNTAAHLQPVNKIYKTSILITEETYQKTGNKFLVRPLDLYAVRGKKEKTKIYELVAAHFDDPEIKSTPWQLDLCTEFTKAYEHFQKGELSQAKALFEQIHQKYPNDFPTQIYLERIK